MTPHTRPRRAPLRSHAVSHELAIGGDWACAHNQVGTLRHVAGALARAEDGEVRAQLLEIERLCVDDSEAALDRWWIVREKLRH